MDEGVRELTSDLLRVVLGLTDGSVSEEEARARLSLLVSSGKGTQLSLAGEPPSTGQKIVRDRAAMSLAVSRVFRHWQKVMGTEQSRLTPGRALKIAARLRTNSEQKITDAIDGCALSTFHMGENPDRKLWNDIELICRDDGKIDKFVEDSRVHKHVAAEGSRSHALETIRSAARQALKEGRTNDYERLNERVRKEVGDSGG